MNFASSEAYPEGQTDHTGLRLLLRGNFDRRGFLRYARESAHITGTVGWVRRRSDESVEVVAYREDGLSDFLHRIAQRTDEGSDVRQESEASAEASNATDFRIRRVAYLLSSEDSRYYSRHGIDTESRQFPILHESGLLASANPESVGNAQEYWTRNWKRPIDTAFHVAFEAVTGVSDPRVVPQSDYRRIWRYFNPGEGLVTAYSHKALFSQLFSDVCQPTTGVVCIEGRFYDSASKWISAANPLEPVMRDMRVGVIKPTEGDNGKGVERIEYVGPNQYMVGDTEMNLRRVLRRYRRNFIVQEVQKQHSVMATPHSQSLNTLRVVTLRWNGEPHYLLTFARFGADGRINDNAGTGGLCVGVQSDGRFKGYAIDEHASIRAHHPSTGIEFQELPPVPNFTSVIEFAKNLHERVPYFDLLSWDIAVDPEGDPVLIECNFRGAVWLYQLASGQPLFGDLTEDVLAVACSGK